MPHLSLCSECEDREGLFPTECDCVPSAELSPHPLVFHHQQEAKELVQPPISRLVIGHFFLSPAIGTHRKSTIRLGLFLIAPPFLNKDASE